MTKLLLTTLFTALMTTATAQTAKKVEMDITPDGASTMVGYLPDKPTGRAIVDLPGGGYNHLSMQNEGHDWANYFNEQGIAYFVLTYRMPGGDRTLPISDAENAIRTVRRNADRWNIQPGNVGIMGFSAGGHLASTVATHATGEARPDFQVLFYPVISMQEGWTHQGSVDGFLGEGKKDAKLVWLFSNDRQVRPGQTPPAIILLASDDRAVPVVTNGLAYYEALLKAGVNASLHAYPKGGHGFGFRDTFPYHQQMLDELRQWLAQLEMGR